MMMSLFFNIKVLVSTVNLLLLGPEGYLLANFWLWDLLGRFHPMVVHFPISILIVALLMEVIDWRKKNTTLQAAIKLLTVVGSASAVVSVALLLANPDEYGGGLLPVHQWLGIATMVFSVVTVFAYFKLTRIVQKTLLFITVVGVTMAGHYGALLTHGEDFLTSTLPQEDSGAPTEGKADLLLAEFKKTSEQGSMDQSQLDRLNLEVRAIFAHRCYQCHSEHKKKGGLVLESKEYVEMGGESGPALVPGKSSESEIIRRVKLPAGHKEIMPKKGNKLTNEEIGLISLWIDQGAQWTDKELKVFPEAPLALTRPTLPESENGLTNPVDRLINQYFKEHKISWPAPIDDRTFLRRASLDIIGVLPSPEDLDHFIQDAAPDKRQVKVKTLLSQRDAYAQNWLSFWNDLLRNDYSGTGFVTGGRKQITKWLYKALVTNLSYDSMVRQLVNPVDGSDGFIRGIEWRGAVNASERVEMQAAQNIGQSLMGLNLKCASCHNSFISNLTLQQTYDFANIFTDSTLELYRCGKPLGTKAKPGFVYTELGVITGKTLNERLEQLSELLVKPENGRLSRTIVNRLWGKLMGRGIIARYDEMDNLPWNSPLLDWLAAELNSSGYDITHVLEVVLTSKAYQLPAVHYDKVEAIQSDKFVFQGPVLRRMSAEQFSDAVSQIVYPMYKAVSFDPHQIKQIISWIWKREMEFDRDIFPKPGTRYFRKIFSVRENKNIWDALAIITADHAYTLYLNGKKISTGSDWTEIQKTNVSSVLQKGKNILAVEAENEGKLPNPAGLLFALKISYQDGSGDTITSDKSWKCTSLTPDKNWTTVSYDDTAWENARLQGNSNWGKLVEFNLDTLQAVAFARSSLVQLDAFQKALGRPTRENVSTSREDQATLLQSLELTNGDFFNNVLEKGAQVWLKKYGQDKDAMIKALYLRSLGRMPTREESELIASFLGSNPKKEDIQDLFWATLLLPEFQFIY